MKALDNRFYAKLMQLKIGLFQQVFLQIFGLSKPEVVWKMWIFLCSY